MILEQAKKVERRRGQSQSQPQLYVHSLTSKFQEIVNDVADRYTYISTVAAMVSLFAVLPASGTSSPSNSQ